MEKTLRECLGCGLKAKNNKELNNFVKDKYNPNNYYTKPWCKKCNAKKARVQRSGPLHGPFLLKRCRDCNLFPQDKVQIPILFVKDKGMKDGYSNLCKKCNSKRAQKHSKENIDMDKLRKRKYAIKKYGLSYDSYLSLIKKQNDSCAICKTQFESISKQPHVDHDHSCCSEKTKSCGYCIRGLLCGKCNLLLGLANDDIILLQTAIRYLQGGESD
jgi:hypothetical protein